MSNVFAPIAANLGDNLKAFRSSAVTAENKGDTTARSLLAAMLVNATFTVELATAAIIRAFGNPKGKSGKPIDKLSGLRNITGGDAVRKMATSVFSIVTNIDADKTTEGTIRKVVTAFVLNETGAPKSLRALSAAVGDAIRAHVKATQPANDEAEADNAKAEAEAEGGTPTETASLVDYVMQLALRIESATPDQRDEALADAMTLLLDTYNSAVDADEQAAHVEPVAAVG